LPPPSVNHRYRTLIVWLAALVGVIVLGGMVHTSADIDNRLDGSDSQRAYDLARRTMPSITGPTTAVVFKTDDPRVHRGRDRRDTRPAANRPRRQPDRPSRTGRPGGISFASVSFMRNGPPTIEDTAAEIEKIAAAQPVLRSADRARRRPFVKGEVPATESIGLARPS
jgi:hypothetical protein